MIPPIYLHQPAHREYAKRQIDAAPPGYVVRIVGATRTDDQNAKLWPMLQDVARQVDWYGTKLADHEWKDVFSASLRKSKVTPGLDGGFVVLGQKTSTMSKRKFSDLIELITAFGTQRGVAWSEPKERKAS